MSEKETDTLEVFDSSAQVYNVVLAEGTDEERTFEQKPLTFFGKIELFSVLADTIEKALSEGASLGELLDELPAASNMNANQLAETDVLVRALAKIIKYSPDLLKDIYCISLGVKRNERDEVKELMETMDDEAGVAVLNHFIEQNWDAMMDFFSKQVGPILATVSGKLQSESTPSKPSKATRQRTPKA